MSNNRLKFEGLDELRASLRRLPAELRGEAQNIVVAHANQAALEIKQKYPSRTGKLRDGVEVVALESGDRVAGAIVRNKAKHAFIFENGTQARHNDIGANRGSMPPGHVFIPAMIRARRRMYDALRELLRRKGLRVIG